MATARNATRAAMPAVTLALALAMPAAAAAPEIGDTVVVKNEVTAESGDGTRKLAKGAKVFQNEILATAKSARAEIEFLDKT